MRCPKDPTCARCYGPTIKIALALKEQFKNSRDFVQRRSQRYAELDRARPVILMAVNLGQVPLLLNWQCSLRANGIDEAAVLPISGLTALQAVRKDHHMRHTRNARAHANC